MALSFTLIDSWDDGKRIHVAATVAASGNYATGGDALDLTALGSLGVPTAQPPIAGTASMEGVAGYDYVFIPGATISAGKAKIFEQASAAGPFAELAAGAYPAAITSDSITFYAVFPKLR